MIEVLKINNDAGIGWWQAVRNENYVGKVTVGDSGKVSAEVLKPTTLLGANRLYSFRKPYAIETSRYGRKHGANSVVVEPTGS